MKNAGVNNSREFIITETTPILSLKRGSIDETDSKLLKGTVVKGNLKTRIIKVGKDKSPFRIIQLSDKKGYISPQVVNLYVGDFANLDGLKVKDKTPVKDTAFGQKGVNKKKKAKNFIINYGLPIAGGVVGYKIATKMGGDLKKQVGYTIFFGLLGCIPRYLYRNK